MVTVVTLALLGGCNRARITCEDMIAWRDARGAPTTENPRSAMVKTVQTCITPGMPRDAVIALLGEPDRTRSGELEYDLGAGAFRMDPEGLVIRFDTQDRLIHTHIKQY